VHHIHPALQEAQYRMARRWAHSGLDESSEVQSFLDLAFFMCPHSPYQADRFLTEVELPPESVQKWVWEQVDWPRCRAAVPKVLCLAVFVWDLKHWADRMRRNEPRVLAVRVKRHSIDCLGVRPRPIAKHLFKRHDPTQTT
jgi:hypothetical protein